MEGWTTDEECLEAFDDIAIGTVDKIKIFLDTLNRKNMLDGSPISVLLILLGQSLHRYAHERIDMGKTEQESLEEVISMLVNNPALANLMMMGKGMGLS